MTIQKREIKASLLLNIYAVVGERILAELRAEPGVTDVRYKSFDGENFTYEVFYEKKEVI
jgi:hypothetical protein